jgi:hypothetical protein
LAGKSIPITTTVQPGGSANKPATFVVQQDGPVSKSISIATVVQQGESASKPAVTVMQQEPVGLAGKPIAPAVQQDELVNESIASVAQQGESVSKSIFITTTVQQGGSANKPAAPAVQQDELASKPISTATVVQRSESASKPAVTVVQEEPVELADESIAPAVQQDELVGKSIPITTTVQQGALANEPAAPAVQQDRTANESAATVVQQGRGELAGKPAAPAKQDELLNESTASITQQGESVSIPISNTTTAQQGGSADQPVASAAQQGQGELAGKPAAPVVQQDRSVSKSISTATVVQQDESASKPAAPVVQQGESVSKSISIVTAVQQGESASKPVVTVVQHGQVELANESAVPTAVPQEQGELTGKSAAPATQQGQVELADESIAPAVRPVGLTEESISTASIVQQGQAGSADSPSVPAVSEIVGNAPLPEQIPTLSLNLPGDAAGPDVLAAAVSAPAPAQPSLVSNAATTKTTVSGREVQAGQPQSTRSDADVVGKMANPPRVTGDSEVEPAAKVASAASLPAPGKVKETSAVAGGTDHANGQAALPEVTTTSLPQAPAAGLSITPAMAGVEVDGTVSALSGQQMKSTPEKDEIAGPAAQKMPGTPRLAGISVKASDNLAGDSDSGPSTSGNVISAASVVINMAAKTAETTLGAVATVVPASSADHAAAQVERLGNWVTQQVVMVQQSGINNIAVSLKPNAETELSLQLTSHNGRIEATLSLERGAMPGLESHWKDLQESLDRQNVQLLPLENKTAARTSTLNSSFDSSSQNSRRQSRDTEQEWVPTGEMAAPLATGKTKATATSQRGWESWA